MADHIDERGLALREKSSGPEDKDLAVRLEEYAAVLRELGRPDDADRMFTRATAIRAKSQQE
jgi:hypothetical protein